MQIQQNSRIVEFRADDAWDDDSLNFQLSLFNLTKKLVYCNKF